MPTKTNEIKCKISDLHNQLLIIKCSHNEVKIILWKDNEIDKNLKFEYSASFSEHFKLLLFKFGNKQ